MNTLIQCIHPHQCFSDSNGTRQSNTLHSTRLLHSPVAPAMVVNVLTLCDCTFARATPSVLSLTLGVRTSLASRWGLVRYLPITPFPKLGLRPIPARLTCETVSHMGDTVPCPSHAVVDVGGVPDAVSHIPVVSGAGSVGTPSVRSQCPLDHAVAGLSRIVIALC